MTNFWLLTIVCFSCLVRPGSFAGSGKVLWVAFMGRTFAFHAALAAMVVGVVGAAFSRGRGRWLPLVLGLVTAGVAWREVRLVWPRDGSERSSLRVTQDASAEHSRTLRVLGMNLLFLSHDTKKVLAQINAADADVLLLQEYHMDWDAALYPALHEKYPYDCRPLREGIFGQAVYSKRPLVGEPRLLRLHREDYCPQVGVAVDVGGRVVEIWDIHLISPSGPREIERQWEQMGVLKEAIEKRERAMVLMGDFNSTPMSWNAELLRSLGLTEAHAAVGRGRGATWPVAPVVKYLPGVRIDQAWGSGEIEWVSSRVGGETGSDHLPNVVELRAASN